VVAVYSTFMQRAVDQVIHDVALPNLGLTLVMDRAGFVGDDGETHQGLYDIALFRGVPNITFMAPASGSELALMLNYALGSGRPCLIRFPKAPCADGSPALESPLIPGRGVFMRQGRGQILILALGALVEQAEAASDIQAAEVTGVDVYNIRFIKPLDTDYLRAALADYSVACLVEDGAASGGLGEQVGDLILGWGLPLAYVRLGAPDDFLPHASRAELLAACGLDAAGIAAALGPLPEKIRRPVFRSKPSEN
jgi:1-deoxy-D-xylulose-5-phosphate synthase